MHFFKSLGQSFLIFNDPAAISKQLAALMKRYKLKKNLKNQKKFYRFFKSLRLSFLKFNDPSAISKQLTTLTEC